MWLADCPLYLSHNQPQEGSALCLTTGQPHSGLTIPLSSVRMPLLVRASHAAGVVTAGKVGWTRMSLNHTQIWPGHKADPRWQQGHPYLQLITSLTGNAITTWQLPECLDGMGSGGGEGKGALPSVSKPSDQAMGSLSVQNNQASSTVARAFGLPQTTLGRRCKVRVR